MMQQRQSEIALWRTWALCLQNKMPRHTKIAHNVSGTKQFEAKQLVYRRRPKWRRRYTPPRRVALQGVATPSSWFFPQFRVCCRGSYTPPLKGPVAPQHLRVSHYTLTLSYQLHQKRTSQTYVTIFERVPFVLLNGV